MSHEPSHIEQQIAEFKAAIEAHIQSLKNNPPLKNILESVKNNIASGSLNI